MFKPKEPLKNCSIEVNPSQMKLNLTEETEKKGFYYLVEQGREKLHLFEVILKTHLTHAVSFNCFVCYFQFFKTELLIRLKPLVQLFLIFNNISKTVEIR